MSQISPPLRVLLLGSILFLAAWFTVLKPGGGDEVVPPPATTSAQPVQGAAAQPQVDANSAVGQAAQQAGAAAAQTDARSTAVEGADPAVTGGTPATSAAAPATQAAGKTAAGKAAASKGAVKKVGLPLSVAKAVAADKVVVLLFWNPKAADDRAVRRAVSGIDRGKRVAVHVAHVKDIARYAPITRGVSVDQSPSVVVVGRGQEAQLLAGYVDRVTVQQAVSDALRASRGNK